MRHRIPPHIRNSLLVFGIILVLFALFPDRLQVDAQSGGIQAWTGEVPANDREIAQEKRTLRPVSIVALRNGSFSGKVIIENKGTTDINGVQASISQFSGPGRIPKENVRIRYAIPYELTGWMAPAGPDTLLEKPPATVKYNRRNGGNFCPVWVTVKVPADAETGDYKATLKVQAQGLSPQTVPG